MTEKMRSRVERVQEILEEAQIPYERIMRSGDAAIYVPSIVRNAWSIQTVDVGDAVPLRLCRRGAAVDTYTRHWTPESACAPIVEWWEKMKT